MQPVHRLVMGVFLALGIGIGLEIAPAAGDTRASWTPNIEFARAPSTQLRILTVGRPATVRVLGKTDTAPVVLTLPDRADYVQVEVVDNSGTAWRQKVEVRARQETKVTLTWRDAPKPAQPPPTTATPPAPVMKYIGTIRNNSQNCANRGAAYKYDVMSGPTVVLSQIVAAGQGATNLSVPAGTYAVRQFRHDGTTYAFEKTDSLSVTQDGWTFTSGCAAPVAPPAPAEAMGAFRNCSPMTVQFEVGTFKQVIQPNGTWQGKFKVGTYNLRVSYQDAFGGGWKLDPVGSGQLQVRPNGWAVNYSCR